MTKEEISKKYADRGKPHIVALSDCESYKDRIPLYCKKHDYKWVAMIGSNLYKKYSCPMCSNEKIKKNKMSQYNLWDINYDVAKLLENPDDAKGLSNSSKKKVWFVCPNCGNRLYKSVVVVSNFGLACNVCSDGFSYPNKLMYNILKNCNVDFITEYSPSWISPRRFDFYLQNYKIIIEMDGELGHGKRVRKDSKISSSESLLIDKEKDRLALEHGYKVIRIECNKSDVDYIKNNVLMSELHNYVDLTYVDWNQCDLDSQKSLVVEVCKYYNTYPYSSCKMISEKYNIDKDTVKKYLEIGYKNNLCPKYERSFGKPIICVESNIIFSNSMSCAKYYDLDSSRIVKCCKDNNKTTGNLHFMYLRDYDKLYKREEPNYSIHKQTTSNKRKVNMYDKQYNYVCTYNSVTEAASKNNKTLRIVIKSCNSKHVFNYGKTFYYANDPNQPDKTKIIPK